jgi:hypothetical protein
MKKAYPSNLRWWLAHISRPSRGSWRGLALVCAGIQRRVLRLDHYVSISLRWAQIIIRLTMCGSESLTIWQCWRTRWSASPHTMHRRFPRNVSLWSIPVLNAVVVDKTDISRSSQPYPGGAPFGWRGSGNVDRRAMVAKREPVVRSGVIGLGIIQSASWLSFVAARMPNRTLALFSVQSHQLCLFAYKTCRRRVIFGGAVWSFLVLVGFEMARQRVVKKICYSTYPDVARCNHKIIYRFDAIQNGPR